MRQEKEAIRLFTENFPGFNFVETPKDQPADIDGFIVKDDTVISGVEVKCRNMTAHDLRHRFDGRWLITYDKIERGIRMCRGLGVDFRGFLYLVPDRMLMIVPIWSVVKGLVADLEIQHTETQATVNGGSIVRLNAYIDVRGSRVIAEL